MCSNRSNYVQMGLIIYKNFAGRYDIRLWIVISRLYIWMWCPFGLTNCCQRSTRFNKNWKYGNVTNIWITVRLRQCISLYNCIAYKPQRSALIGHTEQGQGTAFKLHCKYKVEFNTFSTPFGWHIFGSSTNLNIFWLVCLFGFFLSLVKICSKMMMKCLKRFAQYIIRCVHLTLFKVSIHICKSYHRLWYHRYVVMFNTSPCLTSALQWRHNEH